MHLLQLFNIDIVNIITEPGSVYIIIVIMKDKYNKQSKVEIRICLYVTLKAQSRKFLFIKKIQTGQAHNHNYQYKHLTFWQTFILPHTYFSFIPGVVWCVQKIISIINVLWWKKNISVYTKQNTTQSVKKTTQLHSILQSIIAIKVEQEGSQVGVEAQKITKNKNKILPRLYNTKLKLFVHRA